MKISDFVTKRRYPPPQKLTLWLFLFSQTLVAQTLQVVTKSIEKTFADPKISKVQLWGERSDIDINTWQRQEIKVVIELTAKHPDRSTAEKDLEVMHYTANQSGKEVLIHNYVVVTKNQPKPLSNLKARFVVYMPPHCNIEIQNTFGKTTLKGLQAQTQLQTEFCTVELTEIRGRLGIRTQFGSLKVNDFQGTLQFVSERTDVLLDQIKGECKGKTQFGSLDIQTDKSQVKLSIETKETELRNGAVAKQ